MEGKLEEEEPTVVEEFPAPPIYYQLDTFHLNMKPPMIPTSDAIYSKAYDGAFHKEIEENVSEYDSTIDYKAALHKALKGIIHCAMNLVSFGDPKSNNIAGYAEGLKLAIADFHSLLGQYREHEAREALCDHMRQQLQEVTKLEATLQSVVNEVEMRLQENISS